MIPLAEAHYVELAKIAERDAGLHMPATKQSFMASRLQRRLRRTGIADFGTYLRLLRSPDAEGSAERQAFVGALTTNVTGVYREPHHFAILADHMRSRSPGALAGRYRIWSAGCSTGEEPLSIASVCHAVLGAHWRRAVEIVATDVDAEVLETARTRTDGDLADDLRALPDGVLPTPRRPSERLAPSIAELQRGIVYRQHNLLHRLDARASFDAIFCRNVTIYFGRPAQEAVHALLLQSLRPDGILMIGHSEHLLSQDASMRAIGRTAFRRSLRSRDHDCDRQTSDRWA